MADDGDKDTRGGKGEEKAEAASKSGKAGKSSGSADKGASERARGEKSGRPNKGRGRKERPGADEPFAQRGRGGRAAEEDDERPFESLKGAADSVRKAFMGGFRSVLGADDGIRSAISDSFAREVVSYITRQVDNAKDEVVRMTGNQIRKFLDNLDLGEELQKILTSLSFEIKTEIRFIPNDQGVQSVKPDARVRVKVKGSGGEEEVTEVDPKTRSTIREGVKAAMDSVLGRFGLDAEKGPREEDEEDA